MKYFVFNWKGCAEAGAGGLGPDCNCRPKGPGLTARASLKSPLHLFGPYDIFWAFRGARALLSPPLSVLCGLTYNSTGLTLECVSLFSMM